MAKRDKQHSKDAGAGAAAAVSLLEAASVICCLQSAMQAGAGRLSRFHLPRYFPSKAVGAGQPPSGLTAAKPLSFLALIGIFLLFFGFPQPRRQRAAACWRPPQHRVINMEVVLAAFHLLSSF